MAKSISVEQSAYIQSQQQYLSDLRTGQFAKFLNKNPLYVTYYPVVNALSRVDSGTGAIQEEIGPNSPVRYNKIKNLPAFISYMCWNMNTLFLNSSSVALK